MYQYKNLLLTANLGAMLLLGGALASAHGGDTTRIHACVNNSSGEIKIVGANGTCADNWSRLDWNIQGPAGFAGPQGPTGPAGPQGPQGPAGLSEREVVSVNSGTQTAARIDVIADCPAGKQVLGGGFATAGNNLDVSTMTNAPSGSSWVVTLVTNDLAVRSGWSVQAYAVCARVVP